MFLEKIPHVIPTELQKQNKSVLVYITSVSMCVAVSICHEKRVKIKITLVTVVASTYSVHSGSEHVVRLSFALCPRLEWGKD